MNATTSTGIDARCPACGGRCRHHHLDLFECGRCGRFWDATGEVVAGGNFR